ncbi:hypothetical protein LJB91_03290 [Bacteroidales bacterium OttesenSCG-928-L03]|nr:hypothetical protein [Bacteroidales bacterium OttesenSCG-928-L03]
MLYRIISRKRKIDTPYLWTSFGQKGYDTFFGYYDISPFNEIDKEVLYIEVKKNFSSANIVLNNYENTDKRIVGQTTAWNWQQGCRLRWHPQKKGTIVFNDCVNGVYVSRILDTTNNQETQVPYPLYDLDSSGKWGLTLNFARLGYLRPGYGYNTVQYKKQTNDELEKEGIGLVDMETGIVESLVDYKELLNLFMLDDIGYNECYLNHISFSPDGDKFSFFFLTDNEIHRTASLLVYDLPKKSIEIIERDLIVSHYVWKDNHTILYTAMNKSFQTFYYDYSLVSGKKEIIASDILITDGHPSRIEDNIILSDTYPNRYKYQKLFLANTMTARLKVLLNIYSPSVSSEELRTDLHPRLNKSKTLISFDSNVCGYRQMFLLKDWNTSIAELNE